MEKTESTEKKEPVIKDEAFYRTKQRRFILTIILGFIAFFIFVPFLTYMYFAPHLTSKEAIMNNNDSGIVLLDRNDQPFFSFYQAKFKSFVPLSAISPNIQNAVISVEDRDFYSHPGFSMKSIVRAFIANFQSGGIKQGGSTLTQQLVKNALLTPQKSYMRKYQEIVIAEEIERKYTKKEILEMYLNSVYFGEGAFGVGQAAQVYFGKEAKDLTLAESAMLAGILPSPSALSPISGDPVKAKDRQLLVLKDLLDQHYITQEQYHQASTEQLKYNTTKESINSTAPHFALMVRDELIKNFGEEQVIRSGFKVKTTLDRNWQEYAETAVKEGVDRLAADHVSNGSAVVIDPKTGEILVMVGSKDWYDPKNGKINMATTPREPGSSFKPIVYSYAVQNQIITPGTVLHDRPTTFTGGYQPHDYDGKTRGDMTMRRALANSLNIPAVEVMSKVGVSPILNWAKQLGITTLGDDPSQYGLSLVLGSGEVPLVQMTDFYATLANQGMHNDAVSILQIENKENKVIYTYKPNPQQVINKGVAFIMSNILSDDNAKHETFGNALTNMYNAAVKTGTAENYKNALTLGYLPNIAIGVWVGNNDSSPMDNIAGALGPAPIWKQLMNHFAAELPREYFVKPDGVVSVPICTYITTKEKDGNKEKDKVTVTSQTEYFLAGTEPKTICSPSPSPSISPSASPSPSESPTPTPTSFPSPTPKGETPTPTVVPTTGPTATPKPITISPSISL